MGSCGTPLQVACSKTTQYTCEGSISWHTAPCLLQAQKNTTFIHIAAQQMIPILTIKAENIHHVIVNPPKMQTTIHTVTVLVHSDRVDRFINLVSLLGYLIWEQKSYLKVMLRWLLPHGYALFSYTCFIFHTMWQYIYLFYFQNFSRGTRTNWRGGEGCNDFLFVPFPKSLKVGICTFGGIHHFIIIPALHGF